ncbi:MAG: hypothetical protein M0D57_06680 [Sphingobacteriales bacterium JAD_PAG50586_3]|nr:MAG: hypothetical protein M0D57_06680 [Sphingobacteriales bacterium JAD_PAG50586_3]
MKTTLLAVLMLLGFGASAQKPLNQYNSAKQKDGKWITYWDANWKTVKDSSKARYFRYNVFVNGKEVYPMGPCGKKGWRLEGDTTTTFLDGRYNWYNEKGVLVSTHIFKKGEYVDVKEYYANGKLNQHFAYGQKYRDWPNTWVYYFYDKDGKATRYAAFYNDKTNGWGLHEVTEADTKRVN